MQRGTIFRHPERYHSENKLHKQVYMIYKVFFLIGGEKSEISELKQIFRTAPDIFVCTVEAF